MQQWSTEVLNEMDPTDENFAWGDSPIGGGGGAPRNALAAVAQTSNALIAMRDTIRATLWECWRSSFESAWWADGSD